MNNNNGLLKGILLTLLAIYVISPLDLAPGVADDLLMTLLYAAANIRRGESTRALPQDTLEGSWKEK